MRSFRFGLAWLVTSGALITLFVVWAPSPASAAGDECHATCKDAKRNCAHAAKAAFRGCKESCRNAASRRDCRRGCREALIDARDVCAGGRRDCRDACDREPPPPQECEHCRTELRDCLRTVGHRGKECVSGCLSSRREAARACRHAADPFACFFELARGTAQCLRGCAVGMNTGARRCHAGHAECRRVCAGGGAYGSASAAFLVPPPSLLD